MSARTDARRPLLAGLLAAGALARLVYVLRTDWLEGDPAVLGLMARRIAEGREFPVYLWLAHYSGAASAYVTAVWFKLFGVSYLTFQLTGLLFSCAYVGLIFLLARKLLPEPGAFFATALALIPPHPVFEWTLWYQYGDTAAMGCLLLVLLARDEHDEPAVAAAMGLVSGLALWTSPMGLPFILTQGYVLLRRPRRRRRDLACWAAGFLVGYSPAILYNLSHPGAQFQRMAARFLAVDRASWESSPDRAALLARLLARKLASIPAAAARMPAQFAAETNWLDAAALVAAAAWQRRDRSVATVYLWCFALFHALLVGDPDPRFLFPLYLPFAILVAGALVRLWARSRPAAGLAFSAILAAHAASLAHGLLQPERLGVGKLNAFLRAQGVADGYSGYWIAYPAIFDSKEEIIISPTLFHPTFLDRRPEYTARVRRAEKTAFVVDRGRQSCALPVIEQRLAARGVAFESADVAEFRVYYGFSRKVFPEELELTAYERCPR